MPDLEDELAYRRARLAELARHPDFGGNAALGRALGFQDGAYIGHMIRGLRPITEKLVQKVDDLNHGRFRGWFAPNNQETPGVVVMQDWPLDPFISRDKWESLSPAQRAALAFKAHEALEQIERATPAPSRKQDAA
jgi:hypothetical protein